MQLPTPPRRPKAISPQDLRASAEAIDRMRKALANDGPAIVDTTDDSVEELRDSVVRREAQSTFDAHMRASRLRETIKA